MSRFSDSEREQIQSRLIEAGRELFARFGLERTRIKDITEEVGIGTSTFYQFFDSKETLYVEVLCVERERLNQEIEKAVTVAETPREELRALLRTMLREVRSNPLISSLIVDGELRALQDRLSESEAESIRSDLTDSDLSYARRWTDNENFRYDDPDLVDEMIYALVFVTRSRNIPLNGNDDTTYERMEEALIEVVVDGLFVPLTE
jgi:AcrR family transcriptional regulator